MVSGYTVKGIIAQVYILLGIICGLWVSVRVTMKLCLLRGGG